jgi:hypothetical protein
MGDLVLAEWADVEAARPAGGQDRGQRFEGGLPGEVGGAVVAVV